LQKHQEVAGQDKLTSPRQRVPRFCPGYTIRHSGGSNEIEDVPVFPFGSVSAALGTPQGRAQTGTSVSRMKKMKLGKP
jgi:hypothetical protein